MRTTVTLDDDVYQSARALARSSGRSLGAVISELARIGLRPRPVRDADDGIPAFDVPAGASLIPGDRAAELVAEEGLD